MKIVKEHLNTVKIELNEEEARFLYFAIGDSDKGTALRAGHTLDVQAVYTDLKKVVGHFSRYL